MDTADPARRPLHLGTWLASAIAVGAVAFAVTRAFAGGSCSGHDTLGYVSTCAGLVSSLSLRVGVLAGVVTLLMGLLGAGLLRTAQELEDRQRVWAEEGGGSHSGETPS